MSEATRSKYARIEQGPCIDCGEPTWNIDRCRDCDITYCLNAMTCSACGKMHTARDATRGPIADWLWGPDHRCECPEPKPPTVADVAKAPTP